MEKHLVERIQKSIDFIEENILEKIPIEAVAREALMSQSSFYSIFSSILGTTVKDYIRKRRLSLSACDLVNSDMSVLDIALKYQFYTSESYSRAFKKLFGLAPTTYRDRNLYIDVFPRIALNFINLSGGDIMINREMNKNIVSDNMASISSGYILDIDIDHFEQINANFGYDIGDKVLIEVPERVKAVLESYKLDTDVNRINADEFAVVIKNQSIEFIKKVSKDIIASMEREFAFNGIFLNVTVSIGVTDFTTVSDNNEVIKKANAAMLEAKKNGKNQYKLLVEE